jgi:hypothetical protein
MPTENGAVTVADVMKAIDKLIADARQDGYIEGYDIGYDNATQQAADYLNHLTTL